MAAPMQFWGVEVKAKEPCMVTPEDGVIHLSHAVLGEVKKDNEPVVINVKVGGKKLVLGMLTQNNPQLSFDLVFDKDFEISHNSKNGTIHFLGYQTDLDQFSESDFASSEEDEDEDEELPITKENGKAAVPLPISAKPSAAKPKLENKPNHEEDDDDSDDEDDDFEDSGSEDDGSDEVMGSDDDDEDDSDDEEDSEEETPVKAEAGKKRPNGNAKTPDSKKAKLTTPQKTETKKGGAHSATPHPAKKAGKTPVDAKSPKSASSVTCGSCPKTFNSQQALDSHSKAKHSAK